MRRSSPPKEVERPQAINPIVAFEVVMRLHLGLSRLLRRRNSYNLNTGDGSDSAVKLCLDPETPLTTINE